MESRNIVIHEGKYKYDLSNNGNTHCIICAEDHTLIRDIINNLSSEWTKKNVDVIIGSACEDSALSGFTDLSIIKEFIHSKPSDVTGGALSRAYDIAQERQSLFVRENVKNIEEYNQKVGDANTLPRVIVIIEEIQKAELVNWNKMKNTINKMLNLIRISGVHLIFVTSEYEYLKQYIKNADIVKLNCRY